MLRKFASICSPLAVVEEKVLQLSQKTVLVMGKAKYDSQETIHTLCEHTTNSTLCLSPYVFCMTITHTHVCPLYMTVSF